MYCEQLRNRKIVGLDPGKFNLVYMTDGKHQLQYTAFQRRRESTLTRNERIRKVLKRKDGLVSQCEKAFLAHNSKTMDVEKFKEYVRAKNTLNAALSEFYCRQVHRKMKWRQAVYARKSEDRFIVRMRQLYGKNAVVAYGNWSRTTQMRHFVPAKAVGMRRLISRHFQTFLVDEFRTSKLCCNCHKELSHVKIKHEAGNKKLFRCLVCEECRCARYESPQRVFLTRDLNAALNIRRIAREWLARQTRPAAFRRNPNTQGG